jgi:invasion protein IalB
MVARRERVKTTMAHRKQQLGWGVGLSHAATLAVALGLGIAGLAGASVAQQPAPKKAPDKAPAPAAAPAKKGAAPAGGQAQQSAWVKLCEKAAGIAKDKDGKEEKKEVNICLTHHERLDGNTGMVLVSAAIRQVEGQDKQHFMVMVPLGMLLHPGMRATIYPPDLWEKAQKNEPPKKEDEAKLKTAKLTYTLCHPAGCTAEIEATPELLGDLRKAGGVVVFAINAVGQAVAFPVPLTGFEQAYAGQPVDNKQYGEARKALMQQIAQRQQQLIEERRQQQQQQAPPAAAPPPAKK